MTVKLFKIKTKQQAKLSSPLSLVSKPNSFPILEKETVHGRTILLKVSSWPIFLNWNQEFCHLKMYPTTLKIILSKNNFILRVAANLPYTE